MSESVTHNHAYDGFLLTRQWDDVPAKTAFGRLRQCQLSFWLQTEQGPVKAVFQNQVPVFFLEAESLAKAEPALQRLFGQSASHPSITPVWEIQPLQLQTFEHKPVVGVYFREQRNLYRARDTLGKLGLEPLEGDLQPTDRFLMERFITGGIRVEGDMREEAGYPVLRNPKLTPSDYQPSYKVMSLDIETSMTGDHLYCIGAVVSHSNQDTAPVKRVMMVGEGEPSADQPYLSYFDSEARVLSEFLNWLQQVDPDILIGWNVINFDLRFLQRKAEELNLKLSLGRQGRGADWRQSRNDDEHFTLSVPGRLVMDGIDTLKSATFNFESFSLDAVANELLQRGKLTDDVEHRGATITEQFEHDKPSLAAYNLEDCQLVWDIFKKAKLIEFAVERARLTGLAMDRFGGSVASFDNRYLPKLHRQGYVAPALVENHIGVGSPGGYVMDSVPGLYRHVLVLDFKSLYPSIIRTFHIDPLARIAGWQHEAKQGLERPAHWDKKETDNVDIENLVPGFNGAVFLRDKALLPNLIGELWSARDQAKKNNNASMSQAIKIIMNSFYGVLGTPGCRFFDYRLPSSITLRGHEVLNRSRELIEARGHKVIYGDTDSVFVCLGDAEEITLDNIDTRGRELAEYLNGWWRDDLQKRYKLESFLEIEFETHYSHFVMPTIRGTDTGSKKRYAGVVDCEDGEQQLVFKGLEAVRTDWTPLAREFQRELYRRIFFQEPYDEYILQVLEDVRQGQHDEKLIYRKRIRRRLQDYVRNVPPHVQAARKADEWLNGQGLPTRYERGGWIQYLLTVNGAEPLEHVVSALDYELFIERQIEPIVDGIVRFLGRTFSDIADQQLGLF